MWIQSLSLSFPLRTLAGLSLSLFPSVWCPWNLLHADVKLSVAMAGLEPIIIPVVVLVARELGREQDGILRILVYTDVPVNAHIYVRMRVCGCILYVWYVRKCMCMCENVFTYANICTWHVHICVCIHACIHVSMIESFTHSHIPLYLHIEVRTNEQSFIWAYIHTYTYIRTYIHAYLLFDTLTHLHAYVPTYVRTYIHDTRAASLLSDVYHQHQ